MPLEVLVELPQFKRLIGILKRTGLFDTAWGVLGGVPLRWSELGGLVLKVTVALPCVSCLLGL